MAEDLARFEVTEPETVLRTLQALAPSLAQLFGPSCEIVVHDLRKPESSIVALENGHVSGRRLGGPLVGGPFGDVAIPWLNEYESGTRSQVYETRTRDGRRLKSTTVLYRDADNRPVLALCLNVDLSKLSELVDWAQGFLALPESPDGRHEADDTAQSSDVDGVLSSILSEVISPYRDQASKLSRETRCKVVRELDERGVFLIKGAIRRVAEELSVSKFTIYSDLDELRNS